MRLVSVQFTDFQWFFLPQETSAFADSFHRQIKNFCGQSVCEKSCRCNVFRYVLMLLDGISVGCFRVNRLYNVSEFCLILEISTLLILSKEL